MAGLARLLLIKVAVRRGDVFQPGETISQPLVQQLHFDGLWATRDDLEESTSQQEAKSRCRLWKVPDDKHEVRLKHYVNPDTLVKETGVVVEDVDEENYHSFYGILLLIIILLSQLFLHQHILPLIFSSFRTEMAMLKPVVPYFRKGTEPSTKEALPRSSGVSMK